MDQQTRQFIERMGLFTEAEGLPRIAGRIFGLLLLTPGACSLDEMAETLGVSKASISTDARRLEQAGFVTRIGRPGDRRDYYSIAPNALDHSLDNRVRGMEQFRTLMREARVLPGTTGEVADRIEEWDAWHADMIDALRALLELRASRRGVAAPTRSPA